MAGTVANDILPLRIEFFKNNEWVHEPKAIIPLRWTKQLNEALDVGEFIIMKTTESEPMPPFTKMRIIEGANDEQITYWYASSQVELVTKMPPYYYKHYVAFVEPTKILETITTGGELLTQPTTGIKKSMYDYFDTLLAVNPLRISIIEPQEITIEPALVNYLKGIEAREFTTNHNTLYEAIMEGAQYIHAIPRMTDYNTLSFDFLGDIKEYLENDRYYTWRKGQNPNEYCTALEVQAQNVLDTEKTIWYPTMPGVDLGITVRSETVDLTLDTAELILPFPIYEVKQVKAWGFSVGHYMAEGFFEDAKYYTEETALNIPGTRVLDKEAYQSFPNYSDGNDSQSAHWYYTRYDSKIKGFNQRGYGIIPERFQYAWANLLIKEMLVQNPSSGNRNYHVHKNYGNAAEIQDIKFKIEYVPVSNPRFRQEYAGKGRPQKAVSFDNQSQNLVDIKSFGENLKGKVARFGNKAIEKTTVYKNYKDIPKVGTAQIVDGETYILEVQALEFKNTYYKATNTFTKDFSRISAYIGLNQQRREYELPTSMVSDRKLYRGEYFCAGLNKFSITSHPSVDYNNCAYFLRNAFKQAHSNWNTAGNLCQSSFVSTRGKNTLVLGNFILATFCKMAGDSLLFEFGFANNLSAGRRIEGQWANEKNASLNIPYCDQNGEVSELRVQISASMNEIASLGIDANNLPLIDRLWTTATKLQQYGIIKIPFGLIVKKDARNNLLFNYQLHYVGLDGLVIGQGLIKYAALINESAPSSVKCYILQNELNVLRNGIIDLTGAMQASSYDLSFDESETTYNKYDLFFNSSVKGKAWALVTQDNELLIGENRTVNQGTSSLSMYFAQTATKPI